MASISLNLDGRCAKNGMQTIRLRITHGKTSAYINTGVRVEPQYFDASNFRQPIMAAASSAKIKNEQVLLLIRKYDDTMLRIEMDDTIQLDSLTANDIRTYIIGERECAKVRVQKRVRGGDGDFSTWFDTYAQTKGARVCSDMQYVGRLMADYCRERGEDRWWFRDMDYERLVDMEQWLRSGGRGQATVVKVMSYIRSAWNEAERREMVEYGKSPFRFYKVKPVPVKQEIETISVDALRRMSQLILTDGSELARARDMLLLCFLLCGPDLIDLYHFGRADGELVYTRHKLQNRSARPVRLRLEPEAQMVIDMYRGTDCLLYLQERYPNYKTFQRNFNGECARLSDMVGEKVNMERMRRTWATIAAELDVPDRVIDKSMGHVDSSVLNKHYASYDWGKTAAANRKVMDYVLYGAA